MYILDILGIRSVLDGEFAVFFSSHRQAHIDAGIVLYLQIY